MDPTTGKVYVVAESRLAFIPGAVPKAKKGGKGGDKKDAEPKGWQVSSRPIPLSAQTACRACNGTHVADLPAIAAQMLPERACMRLGTRIYIACPPECHIAMWYVDSAHGYTVQMQAGSNEPHCTCYAQVLSKVKGQSLVGTTYQPLFPYFAHLKSSTALQNGHAADSLPTQPAGAFRVIADVYVKDDSGTGVVHQAPAFGEDDFRICIENSGLPQGRCMDCPIAQC